MCTHCEACHKEVILGSLFCMHLKQPGVPSIPDSQMVNYLPPQHVSSVTSLRASQPQLTQSDTYITSLGAHIWPFLCLPIVRFRWQISTDHSARYLHPLSFSVTFTCLNLCACCLKRIILIFFCRFRFFLF